MDDLDTIHGERIYLARIPDEERYYKRYMELLNAGPVLSGTGNEPHTLEEVKELFAEWRKDEGNMTWGIFRKSDNELIGDVCLRYGYEEYGNDGPEVAIMIGEARSGYGSEAMRILLDYVFKEKRKLFGKQINIINLGLYKENTGALKLYSKLGFEEVMERPDIDNGKVEIVMQMTRDMWHRAKAI
ncbi:MAG TPA: GNAT family N-acetyltransferase [Nanoarchaeota archaeon]|nr:GNAT family N-acetyltransferase [Nanoarchaeota archaeon]